MTTQPEPVAKICAGHTLLQQLSTRSRQLQQFNTLIAASLPPQLRQHCYLANIHDHTVVMHTDSASYATLLRFQAPAVFRSLSGHLPHIPSRLDVRVRPPAQTKKAPSHGLSITPQSAAIIQQTADHIDNPELKAALEKLAQRATGTN